MKNKSRVKKFLIAVVIIALLGIAVAGIIEMRESENNGIERDDCYNLNSENVFKDVVICGYSNFSFIEIGENFTATPLK